MRAAIIALLLSHTAAVAEPIRNLYFLADGNVRFDNGPELDESQLPAEIIRMCAEAAPPEIRLQPTPKTTFEQVGRVLVDFQAAGCGHLGFVGNERAE